MNFFRFGAVLQVSPQIPLQSILKSSTDQAEEINSVTNLFFLTAGGVLLLVAALTAYILYRFRQKAGGNIHRGEVNRKWEIAMIGGPLALVGVFLYLTVHTLRRVHTSAEGRAPEVVITGHQWWWEASYPAAQVTTANEIHLPVGRRLLLKLLAADVIHDWWVPQFGSKMDLIPTQENHLWVTIKEPGEYHGICSEFCGPQHAHMRILVVAQTEPEYEQWLMSHRQAAAPAADQTAGARLFQSKTCGNCHRIAGTAAQGGTGPDLTHLGSRKTLLAGLLRNNPQNLSDWIRHPQQVKPGAYMPDFLLDDSSVAALTAYLYSLK